MNKWNIVAIVGVVILVVGIGLSVYGASSFSGSVSSLVNDLSSKSFSPLSPGDNITITVPPQTDEVIIFNSTQPILLTNSSSSRPDLALFVGQGLYESIVIGGSATNTLYLLNNDSTTVNVKYVTGAISLTPIELADVGVFLLFGGFIVALVGGIASVISYFRKKRMGPGMPPSPPPTT